MKAWKIFAALCCALITQIAVCEEVMPENLWQPDAYFTTPPEVTWGNEVTPLVREIYYEGEPYRGKPTRIFAYYGRPAGEGPFPAVLLIHGGGGKAFKEWAELWAKRGYVALAMDLAGHGPNGKLPDGGPNQDDNAKFRDFSLEDGDYKDMWTYHAIAAILRSHAVLANQPEVDPERIAATGISWGGYLACILAGVDHRLKAVVPVYGCGFLNENSAWQGRFPENMSPQCRQWLAFFDPSQHVGRARCPMLFVNGTNDFAYHPPSFQKTCDLPQGDVWVAMSVRRPHGHIFTFREVDIFIDSVLDSEVKKPFRVTGVRHDAKTVTAIVENALPGEMRKAELVYTTDDGAWPERKWQTAPAEIVNDQTATATLPDSQPTAYYLLIHDNRGLAFSSPITFAD